MTMRLPVFCGFLAFAATATAANAAGNDFPTVDRVEYVQECMRSHPGSRYEMLYKCSCTLDRIATEIRYDEYVELWTAANAISIGGERGAQLRDAQMSRDIAKEFRAVEEKAQQDCFLSKGERCQAECDRTYARGAVCCCWVSDAHCPCPRRVPRRRYPIPISG
jgi:hypothetical protein